MADEVDKALHSVNDLVQCDDYPQIIGRVPNSHQITDSILAEFHQRRAALEQKIGTSDNIDKSELPAYFDDRSSELVKLQKFVADSLEALPSYDLKSCQAALRSLQEDLQRKMDELIPKKKFAFKSRKKEAMGQKELNKIPENKKTAIEIKSSNECGFNSREGDILEMGDEVSDRDVSLHHLVSCTVYLKGVSSTLHISEVSKSKIFVSPVKTSVFVENCHDLILVVACQQLRVHSTTNSTFYLHVTSRAVIEDCTTLQFAPFSWSYPELDAHYLTSGLDRNTNNWNLVQDFNHIGSVKSPNWKMLEESQMQTFS